MKYNVYIEDVSVEAVFNKMGGVAGAKRFLADELILTESPKTPPILELVSTVVVSATSGQFIAKEKFVRDTGNSTKVKINFIGTDFEAWFLYGEGKIENPISGQKLHCHKLLQSSVDGPIITELGGEAKAETTLCEMFAIMERHGKGEEGTLLNNGRVNIFYIKDQNGVLRTVSVDWRGAGWYVNAFFVKDSSRWFDGNHVFSRNSVLKSLESLAPVQA